MSSLTKSDCFIEGHWVPTEKRFSVTNPATGEVLAEVADADDEDAGAPLAVATGTSRVERQAEQRGD